MSILHDLIRTYDANAEFAGVPVDKGEPLCPVSHFIYNAQIEITLDADGNFISATAVDKAEQRTIIPVTEASSSRTRNANAAHPLCEQLEYLIQNEASVKYNAYKKELSAWCRSDESHPFVETVHSYITSGTILMDLALANLIALTEDGELEKGRINGTEYAKCLVRWRINNGNQSIASWECLPLFEAYQNYYNKYCLKNIGVCYLTGKTVPLASVFDKGMVLSCSGAKLVSANDSYGFTYRSFISEPRQIAQIGYEAAQKMHRALRWIANHNGVYIGSRLYVTWCPTENVHIDPANLFDETDNAIVMNVSDYRKRLYRAIKGYSLRLPEDADVIVASFDAATTGRLAVTQYSPLSSSDFLCRLQNWYETCCWPHYYHGIKPVKPAELVTYAYGTQRTSEIGTAYMEANELVVKKTVQALYNAILYGSTLPYEMVRELMMQARHLEKYERFVREQMLVLACSAIRKYYNDRAKKEVWTMMLDIEKKDRSYQFGRLLAVYEKIERDTYDVDEKREPQAIRLQTAFMDHPMRTTMILKRSIDYYLGKLQPWLRSWYRKQIDQIMSVIAEAPEAELNRPLMEGFLLGYSLQRLDMVTRKNKEEDMNDVE